jgi:hypothetical protein
LIAIKVHPTYSTDPPRYEGLEAFKQDLEVLIILHLERMATIILIRRRKGIGKMVPSRGREV